MDDDNSDYDFDSDNEWIYAEETYELAVLPPALRVALLRLTF